MRQATIGRVTEDDLAELLALMRAYCDFYQVNPADEALLSLSRALLADAEHEGVQLIARDHDGRAVGFATIFWSWNTLNASRLGIMNDLYVHPVARGTGLADQLVAACVEACRVRGGVAGLGWQTAPDNFRAQAVYVRVGAERAEWIDFSLPIE